MKTHPDKLPIVRPSEIIGHPDGWTADHEFEHYMRCPRCGQWIDMRNLGMALDHTGELPHGPGIKMQ